MESGALQDFPIPRSVRDCVYLRFTEMLRRRKLHVSENGVLDVSSERAEANLDKKERISQSQVKKGDMEGERKFYICIKICTGGRESTVGAKKLFAERENFWKTGKSW